MQEHLLSPYDVASSARRAPTYGLDKHVFHNWDPFVNKPMNLPAALAPRATRTSTTSATASTSAASTNAATGRRCRTGRGSSASASGRPRHRRRGGRPRADARPGAKRIFKTAWDRAWNPGDSIQLAIGQKDVTVTPLQMARFYAMIANGGKLVTPYVVSGVEQPGERRPARRAAEQFPPDPPRAVGVDPAALSACGTGLYEATHDPRARRRASSAPTRSRSPARPERPRRSSTSRAIRPGISRTSRGGAATGRPTTPSSSSAP